MILYLKIHNNKLKLLNVKKFKKQENKIINNNYKNNNNKINNNLKIEL